MTSSIAAVVLAHNEAQLLALTLPSVKACVDEVIMVDMGSTDGRRRIYEVVLGDRDRVISYEKRNPSLFGFAHARNYGAKFTTTDWIFSVDSDAWIARRLALGLDRTPREASQFLCRVAVVQLSCVCKLTSLCPPCDDYVEVCLVRNEHRAHLQHAEPRLWTT